MVTHNQVIPQPCRFLATGAEDGPLGGCVRCLGNFYRAITHAGSVPNRPSAVKRCLSAPGLSSVAKAVGTQPVSLVERVAMRTPLTPGPAAQPVPTYGALVGDARGVVGAQAASDSNSAVRNMRASERRATSVLIRRFRLYLIAASSHDSMRRPVESLYGSLVRNA
jgi:hypothetical protein